MQVSNQPRVLALACASVQLFCSMPKNVFPVSAGVEQAARAGVSLCICSAFRKHILQRFLRRQVSNKPRVLVCAPSNAATDELCERILKVCGAVEDDAHTCTLSNLNYLTTSSNLTCWGSSLRPSHSLLLELHPPTFKTHCNHKSRCLHLNRP